MGYFRYEPEDGHSLSVTLRTLRMFAVFETLGNTSCVLSPCVFDENKTTSATLARIPRPPGHQTSPIEGRFQHATILRSVP